MAKIVLKSNKYQEFMEDLDASCALYGYPSRETAFLDERCKFLVEQDVLQNYTLLGFNDETSKSRIDAWGLRPDSEGAFEDEAIVLVISLFEDSEGLQTVPFTDFRTYVNRAKRFFQHCLTRDPERFPANTNIREFAKYIYSRKDRELIVSIIGITNRIITSRTSTLIISENSTDNISFKYDVWDFTRFSKIENSASGRESVDIDFVRDYGVPAGLPALHTDTGSVEVSSYVFICPGIVLAKMYEQWNERLLEQNPRTFLQFIGKINKGIRGTLYHSPECFFSFNNGISAVADDLEFDPKSGNITKIRNFQIVNGGQTTASIYNAHFRSTNMKVDIDRVFVLVKLSVIQDRKVADDLIPKISVYSNSQNKVPSSAFSVRHPYHKAMEEFSRSIHAPLNNERVDTKWFYERVQGQYKNAFNLCKTQAEKRKFKKDQPKDQMFKTVDLAKFVMTFDLRPDVVCRGSQKCYGIFSQQYLKVDESTGEGIRDASVNEDYFKEVCCYALLFRALSYRVSSSLRFVVVPYTLACVVKNLKDAKRSFNYKLLWQKQWDNDYLFDQLADYSKVVYNTLIESMPENVSIISEWGKKRECWDVISKIEIDVVDLLPYTISMQSYIDDKNTAKQMATFVNNVNDLKVVLDKGNRYWSRLYKWIESGEIKASGKEMGCLLAACSKTPSEKQAKVVLKLESRAIASGFTG